MLGVRGKVERQISISQIRPRRDIKVRVRPRTDIKVTGKTKNRYLVHR